MDRDFTEIVELLANVTDAFTAALFLFDHDSGYLKLVACHTLSKLVDYDAALKPGDGVIGWVFKSGQAVNISPFDVNSRGLRLYREAEEIKSFLGAPIHGLGVLCVDSKQSYTFTEKNQKILAGFAKVIVQLIEAKNSRRREEDYGRMLNLIYGVDRAVCQPADQNGFVELILNEVRTFAKMDLAFLTRPNNDRSRYTVIAADGIDSSRLIGGSHPIDSGLVGWVYKSNRRLILPHSRERKGKSFLFSPQDRIRGFQSFIGLPLSLWGKTAAVLGMAGRENKTWTADEIHTMTMTGHRIASACAALAA